MQLTVEIPDSLADQLKAAGMDPARIALEAWRDSVADADAREAIRQAREDVQAGRTVPLHQGFAQFREKHGLDR
ncbi:hypothetical protein SAMN05421819_0085 [Bryocella elongata]|uniref:Uncharacterized protein n=1 Tax=Bryocella elongata TaxID=863522 RepID=A0A1H5S815_9BACT|nr:hypothetical protein SAMN05421819_0085 [Bryocella elongata]